VSTTRKVPMPNYISVKVCDELYALIAKEAERTDENLIDVVVRAVAAHFKRPDLGEVPRRAPGRKPWKHAKQPV
jgi:hypothetical protein